MELDSQLIKGSIGILILRLLGESDMYGYQLIKELNERSGGVLSFKEGTLYPMLHSLEKGGYIKSYWEDTKLSRKRKYYFLTESGKQRAFDKLQEWDSFSKAMENVLRRHDIVWGES